jgi:hypothetical protein
MTLSNLARIGQLKPHNATAQEVCRLLAAARRNMKDAGIADLSDETRFDAAYKAIMQCAMVALLACGYRPATNMPGHHLIMIQSLTITMGVHRDTWLVLDAMRKKRNISDYTGDPIDPGSLQECLLQAEALLVHAAQWLMEHRPDLLQERPSDA